MKTKFNNNKSQYRNFIYSRHLVAYLEFQDWNIFGVRELRPGDSKLSQKFVLQISGGAGVETQPPQPSPTPTATYPRFCWW